MVLTVRFYTKKYDFLIKKKHKIEVCPCFFQFNICLFRVLLNAVNDEKTVSIIKEDALPVITAQNNMINLGFTFFSGFSTHLFLYPIYNMVLTVRFYTKKYDFFIKKTQNRGLSLFFPKPR